MITLFVIHYSLFISPARAQYVATVIDAVTHERLPFASVWVDGATSTITNAVGSFHLVCSPADVLRTPIEEDVFQLFESKQLFGVFK